MCFRVGCPCSRGRGGVETALDSGMALKLPFGCVGRSSWSPRGACGCLQVARDERCRITLMARMNPENTALETFYLTTRLKNRCKVHITENCEWLDNGVRLTDLRSFYEVVIGRQWK
jgi:hypothetical protein